MSKYNTAAWSILTRGASSAFTAAPTLDLGEDHAWTRSLAPTGAVAVGGRLRDGTGQGPTSRLRWELGKLLHVICKLDLLKVQRKRISGCSLRHIIFPGCTGPWLPSVHLDCCSHRNEHHQMHQGTDLWLLNPLLCLIISVTRRFKADFTPNT